MLNLFCSPFVPSGLSASKCGATCSSSYHLLGSTSCSFLASCSRACPAPQSSTLLHPPAVVLPTPVLLPPCCRESSPASCASLPLLPVWMDVSSLITWFSDFHTVQFSVSSYWLLFLNCCSCSFGCERRHSVSTYTTILARSRNFSNIFPQ